MEKNKKPFRFDYDTGNLNCILCKNIYTTYDEQFIIVISRESSFEITYELCLHCVNSLKNCGNCKRKYEEPWEKVYLDLSDNSHCGSCCFTPFNN